MPVANPNETFSGVFPVLNGRFKVPTSVPIPLSDTLNFQKIRGDDLAIITEKDAEAFGKIQGGTYTLTFRNFDPASTDNKIQDEVTSALFALNILGNGVPLSLEKCYIIRSLRVTRLQETKRISGHRHGIIDAFEISKGTDLAFASKLYPAILKALQEHPPLRITISRYNSAIGRGNSDDRLIDLCIALESIFQSQTEISFQFALYNSILSETDPAKREGIFKLLKKLYSQRSNVVHGNKNLDEDWLSGSWPDLLRITKASILRKIDFLTEHEHSEWRRYLEGLALGTNNG